jgi:hypothetical protein
MLLLLMKTFMAKFSCLFDFVKVPESPKYTKQRLCPVELNKNAKGGGNLKSKEPTVMIRFARISAL